MSQQDRDPIVGKWDFRNGNICTFTEDGWVLLCGERIGLWKEVSGGHYVLAYLRTYPGGLHDPLELDKGGDTIRAMMSNGITNTLLRVDD